MTFQERVIADFRQFHQTLCRGVERLDSEATFRADTWQRPGGGGGTSCIIENGAVFEKAGVNFSEVHGEFTPEMAKAMPGDGLGFVATGVSWVLHPRNPFVPTVHGNFRFLVRGQKSWFGGGSDLTPYYPFREDVIHFHRTWKTVCDQHSQVVDYKKLKTDCDTYFYLPHRNECRGVGGIFFDNLYTDADPEAAFGFVQAASREFLTSYAPIVERRKNTPYTEAQREFQEYRRGRYVEFNLIFDRGTLFGLKTNGRIESILMSLPPVVRYKYDWHAEPGSPEAALTEDWLKPRNWADEVI